MIKERMLFVINPISGGKRKAKFVDQAERYLDKSRFDPVYRYTNGPDQASDLTRSGISEGFRYIIAVGGDGTINEVARHLLNSPITLGVIPYGSGNGFARSLNIPLNIKGAVELLNSMRIRQVDTGTINGLPFFNMAGLGFDASVSARFSTSDHRGVLGYMSTVVSVMMSYRPRRCRIESTENSIKRKVFMLSIANSPQFGNGAYIAPNASMCDGLLDICIVKPFPIWTFPFMVLHLFRKTADKSKFVEILKVKDVTIYVDSDEIVHLDGDPQNLGEVLRISILANSLKVIF